MTHFIKNCTIIIISTFLLLITYLYTIETKKDIGDLEILNYDRPAPDSTENYAICNDIDTDTIFDSTNGILVFGDSFSMRTHPDYRWTSLVSGKTKIPITCISDLKSPVALFLSYLTYSPHLLADTIIIESVEREFVERFSSINFDTIPYVKIHSPKQTSSIGKVRSFTRRLLGISRINLRADLDASFFSCKPNRLSYVSYDTMHIDSTKTASAMKNMERLIHFADSNGKKLFILIIPDKYTVYHKHIIDENPRYSNRLAERIDLLTSSDRLINPLPLLDNMVESGIKDIYLPDDTHFSSIGHSATAIYVTNFIHKKTEIDNNLFNKL